MFKNKILAEIYNKIEKPSLENITSCNITKFERFCCFIPVLNFYGINKIKKKLHKVIKDSGLENVSDFDINNNIICGNILNTQIYRIINSIFLILLTIILTTGFSTNPLCLISAIALPIFILLTILLGIKINYEEDFSIKDEKNEKIIKEYFLNKEEENNITNEEMILISESIDKKVLENFLIKNDFKINYKDLKTIDSMLLENNEENKDRIKAKKIIKVLSENKIKEKEDVYV